jgi:hypothetical protein
MNIITTPFVNDINLAICIFPADTLHHAELEERMMDYTTFYALRFSQLCDQQMPLEVYHAASIEAGLQDLCKKYDHILFMAAGVRIYDISIILDIKKVITDNPNYFVAAHILDWKDKWYELHHQFILVDTKKWIAAKNPVYGGWIEQTEELPIIERSKENFHDDYTPLWIKFTGRYEIQTHQKQGWNFINQAARNNYDIINWDGKIRAKRTYYYPESNSDDFLKALKTLSISASANFNQKNIISQIKNIGSQIWVLNSENMDLELNGETFDTIALPAAGFKFLDVFYKKSLTNNGKLILFDYNEKSIAWLKYVYTENRNIEELFLDFEFKSDFKFLEGAVFGNKSDGSLAFTKPFVDSLQKTKEFFGGEDNFKNLVQEFRNLKNVEFIKADLFSDSESLTNNLVEKTAINISNIFCTDFSIAYYGMSQTTDKLRNFIGSLKTETLILGQDSYCRLIRKRLTR